MKESSDLRALFDLLVDLGWVRSPDDSAVWTALVPVGGQADERVALWVSHGVVTLSCVEAKGTITRAEPGLTRQLPVTEADERLAVLAVELAVAARLRRGETEDAAHPP
ncbi:MAG: hypothetical protein ACK5MT_17370 [Actinomycetales bacterium]